MQMVKHLQEQVPVIYVNSIGVRVPKPGEGAVFLQRVIRKVRSWGRGFVRISPEFATVSPITIPGRLRRLFHPLAVLGLRRAVRRMGMKNPLVWITCPPAANMASTIASAGLVYQRTDRWEEFPGCDRQQMLDHHRSLADRADLTLYCSKSLMSEEADQVANPTYLDHGVDYECFAAAGEGASQAPLEFENIPEPRVGFIGGIDSHTFDARLFLEVAQKLPDKQFVLVGACSLPAGWCNLPNVHLLGRKPYSDVAAYMGACDVLIMPWNDNDWIEACNPIKLKEYLAVGRPIVSRYFPQLDEFAGLIRIAKTSDQFANEISNALADPGDASPRREAVERDDWASRAARVLSLLSERGLSKAP